MKIQATIAGFKGAATTLIGLQDERTGVLVVYKEVKYREERIDPDFAVVSNLDLADMDFIFTDKLLGEAIRAFYTRRAQQTMKLESDVERYNPDNQIDSDSVTESGRNYRISGEIHNGQMAVLAMVAFFEQQKPITVAFEEMKDLTELYSIIKI